MINNLGFVIIKIENNEYYDMILNNIRKLIENNPYSNICIFNSSCSKINTYNIPIFHLSHAKFFSGDLWLFDLSSVIITKNFTNIHKKILYTSDMPWVKNRSNPYKEWENIYDSSLSFVAQNSYLYDVYNLCWKQPLATMETFDHEKIQLILQSTI